MLYPFVGSLSFILTLIFMGASSTIIFMHKADGIKYTVRRRGWLVASIAAGSSAFAMTAYCVIGSMENF